MSGIDEFAGTGIGDAPGTGGGTGSAIDPAALARDDASLARDEFGNLITNADGTYRKKRGRKAGSGSGANPGKKVSQNLKGSVDGLSRTLLLLHVGLASVTKAPEIALDQSESDMLAQATVNVLDQFDIRPNPKAEAIFGLIVAAGMVYGPRAVMIRKRLADEKAKSEAEL